MVSALPSSTTGVVMGRNVSGPSRQFKADLRRSAHELYASRLRLEREVEEHVVRRDVQHTNSGDVGAVGVWNSRDIAIAGEHANGVRVAGVGRTIDRRELRY